MPILSVVSVATVIIMKRTQTHTYTGREACNWGDTFGGIAVGIGCPSFYSVYIHNYVQYIWLKCAHQKCPVLHKYTPCIHSEELVAQLHSYSFSLNGVHKDSWSVW